MKKSFNPFHSYNFTEICSRDQELQKLSSNVENQNNIVLYGRRRIGKSTLIKCFFDDLYKHKRYDTLFVDLTATQSIEEAIAAITIAIYEKFGKTKSGLAPNFQAMFSQLGVSIDYHPYTGKPIISKGQKSFTLTEKSLTAIGNFLTQRRKPVIIALDEFQQISHFENGNEEAVFRGWVQQFPSIRFLFIGSPPEKMRNIFSVKNRPFYKSAEMIMLAPIPLSIYNDFIKDRFLDKGKSISDKLISKIYDMARGETYTVQLLCHHLYTKSKVVKEEDVDQVFINILNQQHATYADYARMLTRNQWNLFKAIAKEEPLFNPLSKDFVMKYQLGAVSTVSTALKALQKLGLVVEEDRAYLIHDVLLGRWMSRLV